MAVQGDNFAVVPLVGHSGKQVQYGIVFSLDPVKGLPVDLHMGIKTAYPCTRTNIVTFGSVRFRHLVALRMMGKRPGRITGQHRKVPKLP